VQTPGRAMTKDLTWCLPFDEQVLVTHWRGDDGCSEYVVDHYYGDGGHQYGPFPTRRAARAAALALVEEIYREWGR
jgi:hypothetical protein